MNDPAPRTYRRKPTTVPAMQWDGTLAGATRLAHFTDGHLMLNDFPTGMKARLWVDSNQTWVPIVAGEWVLKDSRGFYPCAEVIFAETYEIVP